MEHPPVRPGQGEGLAVRAGRRPLGPDDRRGRQPRPLERIVAEADKRGVKLFLRHNSGGADNTGTGTPRDLMVDAAPRRAHFKKPRDLGVAGVKVDMWEADKQQS
ncbi:hypothetical protein [Streptomyces ipomoeae]|uniref:hypothetical protein n=1 Tax=Streptomyces ipomoeae TaxID=103232 RepID=UPI0011478D64|nr:hypothetical protein [Streptomyces ipomoeae]MDX2936751.1 hypothetical protein [Streptomyces ipomoeae]TQE18662.1 hypothetical protein SipoB123_33130 [Streptomyces ipomoeae]